MTPLHQTLITDMNNCKHQYYADTSSKAYCMWCNQPLDEIEANILKYENMTNQNKGVNDIDTIKKMAKLWHDPEEKPIANKILLVEYTDGYMVNWALEDGRLFHKKLYPVKQWAYISDLTKPQER